MSRFTVWVTIIMVWACYCQFPIFWFIESTIFNHDSWCWYAYTELFTCYVQTAVKKPLVALFEPIVTIFLRFVKREKNIQKNMSHIFLTSIWIPVKSCYPCLIDDDKSVHSWLRLSLIPAAGLFQYSLLICRYWIWIWLTSWDNKNTPFFSCNVFSIPHDSIGEVMHNTIY